MDFNKMGFKGDGRLKLLIIVGTRPEIIRLAAVIAKCRKYFDCLLAHTGQMRSAGNTSTACWRTRGRIMIII